MNRLFVLAICLLPLGVVGFLAQLGLGERVSPDVELPNQFGSVKVTAPDGRVFIASVPVGRVQRYGPDGFERGFPVDSRGGERKPCQSALSSDGLLSSPSCPANANVPAIASSWFAVLAVPLWHPLVAWSMALVGILILKTITFPPRKRS